MSKRNVIPKIAPKGKTLSDRELYSTLSIGERLRLTRKAMNCTQQEWVSQLSIRRETLTMYELGKREPSPAVAIEISDAFGVTLDWIYKGEIAGLREETRKKIFALSAKAKVRIF